MVRVHLNTKPEEAGMLVVAERANAPEAKLAQSGSATEASPKDSSQRGYLNDESDHAVGDPAARV